MAAETRIQPTPDMSARVENAIRTTEHPNAGIIEETFEGAEVAGATAAGLYAAHEIIKHVSDTMTGKADGLMREFARSQAESAPNAALVLQGPYASTTDRRIEVSTDLPGYLALNYARVTEQITMRGEKELRALELADLLLTRTLESPDSSRLLDAVLRVGVFGWERIASAETIEMANSFGGRAREFAQDMHGKVTELTEGVLPENVKGSLAKGLGIAEAEVIKLVPFGLGKYADSHLRSVLGALHDSPRATANYLAQLIDSTVSEGSVVTLDTVRGILLGISALYPDLQIPPEMDIVMFSKALATRLLQRMGSQIFDESQLNPNMAKIRDLAGIAGFFDAKESKESSVLQQAGVVNYDYLESELSGRNGFEEVAAARRQ